MSAPASKPGSCQTSARIIAVEPGLERGEPAQHTSKCRVLTSRFVYLTIRRRYSMTEMPGGAREWNRVSASGVKTTWSLCWHRRSSMCAIRTTSVSVGQSMKAQGSSGSWPGAAAESDVEVEVEACIGVPLLDSLAAADERRPLCGIVVMSRGGGRYGAMCSVE